MKMMEGAISGKTGFTGDAGYCYVGALRRDDRTFVVALLGCGWPNNKTYKWSDTKKLMNYGLEHFKYRNIEGKCYFKPQIVTNGIPVNENLEDIAEVEFELKGDERRSHRMLLGDDEEIEVKTDLKHDWKAPVKKGESAGKVFYCLGDEVVKEYEIVTANEVAAITLQWCIQKVVKSYVCILNM